MVSKRELLFTINIQADRITRLENQLKAFLRDYDNLQRSADEAFALLKNQSKGEIDDGGN